MRLINSFILLFIFCMAIGYADSTAENQVSADLINSYTNREIRHFEQSRTRQSHYIVTLDDGSTWLVDIGKYFQAGQEKIKAQLTPGSAIKVYFFPGESAFMRKDTRGFGFVDPNSQESALQALITFATPMHRLVVTDAQLLNVSQLAREKWITETFVKLSDQSEWQISELSYPRDAPNRASAVIGSEAVITWESYRDGRLIPVLVEEMTDRGYRAYTILQHLH